MDDVEEKRVYDDRAGKADLLVAAAIGVLSVEVSADRVGRFGLAHRCEPADVASDGGLAAVATAEDVLVREAETDDFRATEFGPAAAVGIDDGVIAASPDGRLARSNTAGGDEGWTDLGRIDAGVRAIDGRLVATADGVHRLPDLDYVGLDDARDVAAAGPLAATGDGLFSLGNGWMDELTGEFGVAAAGGKRAHAATSEAFFERRADEWRAVELPAAGPVVDVAYGEVPYAVTAGGILLAGGEGGWRAHSLGVEGVVGCALG